MVGTGLWGDVGMDCVILADAAPRRDIFEQGKREALYMTVQHPPDCCGA